MKKIGLIGGTSWVSTIEYYRFINEGINKQKGGLNFAELLIYSLNHGEFKALLDNKDWPAIAELYSNAGQRLQSAGAECILVCAVTPHKIAEQIKKAIDIPLIHIAEVVADEVVRKKIRKVGLIGTRFTMEESFFKEKLASKQIETIIPGEDDRCFIQETIFSELGKGIFKETTKNRYLEIITTLAEQGIEAIIFACTEFPLLIKQEECPVMIIDPTVVHVAAAVEFSLSN